MGRWSICSGPRTQAARSVAQWAEWPLRLIQRDGRRQWEKHTNKIKITILWNLFPFLFLSSSLPRPLPHPPSPAHPVSTRTAFANSSPQGAFSSFTIPVPVGRFYSLGSSSHFILSWKRPLCQPNCEAPPKARERCNPQVVASDPQSRVSCPLQFVARRPRDSAHLRHCLLLELYSSIQVTILLYSPKQSHQREILPPRSCESPPFYRSADFILNFGIYSAAGILPEL